MTQIKQVDLRAIITSKSAKLARRIPNFIYAWLNRLLHIEEVNEIIRDGWELTPQEFLRHFFARQKITYSAKNLEKIDPSGRYIIASNHPFGGMDGMMIADLLIAHFGDGRALVNDILMNLDPLKPLWLPVNTLGRQNPQYAKMFDEALAGDLPILTFPAGICSRVFDGEICDPEWKSTFVKRAAASGRQVVPLYVDGTLHKGFYRLYRLRKFLGVKANLEMLLLVDGMFRQKGKEIKMVVGKPISLEELQSFGSPKEQALEVRRRTYELKKQLDR